MIDCAFHHLPGIGPRRLLQLEQTGIRNWDDLEARLPELRFGPTGRDRLRRALDDCRRAHAAADIACLVATLHPVDHWRILGTYFDQASYFDIETSGLGTDSLITVIACRHQDTLQTFVRGRNLDAFLDLLEDVRLLVSFNGASFDVPRLLHGFHIPSIPCPHLDLRWMCHRQQLRGGLKRIEQDLGIRRPTDLQGVDGAEAVWLWELWESRRNPRALERLVRYCAADAACLPQVAARLLAARDCPIPIPDPAEAWACLLPELALAPPTPADPPLHDPPTPDTSPAMQRLQRHWIRLQQR